jgi:hypothetical protein
MYRPNCLPVLVMHVGLDWKASSPSGAKAVTARDAAASGSRSRTRRIRRSSERC